MNGLTPSLAAAYRMLWIYLTKPEFRKAVNDMAVNAMGISKDFMNYYGYGIYAGRKPL